MSWENPKEYLWITQKNTQENCDNHTLLDHLLENNYQQEKNNIVSQTKETKCFLIENSLKNGILIKNEWEYNTWKKILQKNNIFDLSKISFIEFNQWKSFVIQKEIDSQILSFFPEHEDNKDLDSSLWWGKWGEIKNWWNFEKYSLGQLVTNAPVFTQRYPISSLTTKNIPENFCEETPIPPEEPQTSEPLRDPTTPLEPEVPQDREYSVKKWDHLWKIIRREYEVTNNTDVANIANKIIEVNPFLNNNPNKILPWQKIILPREITIREKIFTYKK